MSKKLYEESNIQAIADAIRAKNSSTDTYTTAEMAEAIENIPSGGGVLTYSNMDFSIGDTIDLSELPDLSSLTIAEDELVIYFTYDLTDTSYDNFFVVGLVGCTWNADLGHIESGEYIVDTNIATAKASNTSITGLLTDYTTEDYPIIRITPVDNTKSILYLNCPNGPTINSYAYLYMTLNIIDTRLSLPKATAIRYATTQKTRRFIGENLLSLTSLYFTFQYSFRLLEITFKNVDVSKVTSANGTFNNCHLLKYIDLSLFNFSSSLNNLASFCGYCYSLEELIVPDTWDTSNVTSLNLFFYNCLCLKKFPNIGYFDVGKVTNIAYLFANCYLLEGVIDLTNWTLGKLTTAPSAFGGCYKVTKIIAPKISDGSACNDYSGIFSSCHKATSITGYEDWDVSGALYLSSIFLYCRSLESIDMSKWVNAKFYTISGICLDCRSAKTIKFGAFDGSNLVNNTGTYYNCNSILLNCYLVEELDLGNCTNWSANKQGTGMFSNDGNLKKVVLPQYMKLNNYNNMFNECDSLITIENLDKMDTSICTALNGLFNGCRSLEEVDVSSFNITTTCTTITNMFSECKNLRKLILSDSWDLSKCTSLYYFIGGCSSLESLEISFSTASINNLLSFISGLYNIKYIDFGDLNFSKITSSGYMANFSRDNCPKLVTLKINSTLPSGYNLTFSTHTLSKDSLLNIIDCLPTVTTTRTLSIGWENRAKLTTDEIAVATNKGWTVG